MFDNFEFSINSEVFIDEKHTEIYKNIIAYLRERNIKKLLIITGPHLNKMGVAVKIKNNIETDNIKVKAIYSDIPQDGNIKIIDEIIKLIGKNKCDGIITVGGGSVMDIAKAVKLAYSQRPDTVINGGYGCFKKISGKNIPLLCIPTTAGTGSEFTKVIVVKDTELNRKEEILSDELLPDYSVLSSEFIKTLPAKSTFTAMIDALTHAIEAYTSLERNIISDSYAEESIKIILNNFDDIITFTEDGNFRLKSLIASSMAGIAFSNSMVGLAHAIAHALGGEFGIPHDLACSLILTDVMKFNLDVCLQEYRKLYALFDDCNDDTDGAEKFIKLIDNKICKYYKKFDIDKNLRNYGLNNNNIDIIAEKAYYDGARLTNAKPVKICDIKNLLIKRINVEL